MYGDRPDRWDDALAGWDRLRVIVNAMTRMRFCDRQGRIDFATARGVPEEFLLGRFIVESGQMTKDLALLISKDSPWLTTQDFLAAIDANLKKAMA